MSSSVVLLLSKLRQQTIISPLYLTARSGILADISSHENISAPGLYYQDSLYHETVKGKQVAITESLNASEALSVLPRAVM